MGDTACEQLGEGLTDNVRLTSGIIVHAQHEEARDSQTCDRSIVNVKQTTRTEMTSTSVSDFTKV